jgi:hypothetical protein
MKNQAKLERTAEKYGNNVYTVPHFQEIAKVHFIEGALWLARQLRKDAKAQKVAPEFLKARIALALKGAK